MPAKVVCGCARLHRFKGTLRQAIIAMADSSLGTCVKGSKFRIAHHRYPNSKTSDDLDVLKVVRIPDSDHARYEPYLLLLKRRRNRSAELWPLYWVRVEGRWKCGQFAPLVRPAGLKKALSKIWRHR